jgi:uncharacterized damage-inducible protein DinB
VLPEPWLRGPIAGVHPAIAPVLYAFQQAREDLEHYTHGLTTEQLWAAPHGFASVGFHIRHIAESTERLTTYLEGRELTPTQLAALEAESQPGTATRDELLILLDASFRYSELVVRGIDVATLTEPRYVGRKMLPSTVIGLLTHIAEHTQRHVGQAITMARWITATTPKTE